MSLGTISGKKKTTHLMCACIPGVHINKISMQNPILRTIRLHVYKKMHYLQRYLFFCNLAYWTVKFCEILLIEFRLKQSQNKYNFCFEAVVRFYVFKTSQVHSLIEELTVNKITFNSTLDEMYS